MSLKKRQEKSVNNYVEAGFKASWWDKGTSYRVYFKLD
jgi:hypothetical protein